jgi:hypothetical protein
MFKKKEHLEDYKDSEDTAYVPFFKTSKKMQFMADGESQHGIPTMPSDDIRQIVNHGYEKQYLETKTKFEQNQLLKLLMKEENPRSQDTKASIMRNQAIKDKIEKSSLKVSPFKLKNHKKD